MMFLVGFYYKIFSILLWKRWVMAKKLTCNHSCDIIDNIIMIKMQNLYGFIERYGFISQIFLCRGMKSVVLRSNRRRHYCWVLSNLSIFRRKYFGLNTIWHRQTSLFHEQPDISFTWKKNFNYFIDKWVLAGIIEWNS